MPTSLWEAPRPLTPHKAVLQHFSECLMQRQGKEAPCSPQSSPPSESPLDYIGFGLDSVGCWLDFMASSHEGLLFSCSQNSGGGLPPGSSGRTLLSCSLLSPRLQHVVFTLRVIISRGQDDRFPCRPQARLPSSQEERRGGHLHRPVEPVPFYQGHPAGFSFHASISPARTGLCGHH